MTPYLENVPFPYNQGEESELTLIGTAMGNTPLGELFRELSEFYQGGTRRASLTHEEAEEVCTFLQVHIPVLEAGLNPAQHDAIVQPFLTIYERLSR